MTGYVTYFLRLPKDLIKTYLIFKVNWLFSTVFFMKESNSEMPTAALVFGFSLFTYNVTGFRISGSSPIHRHSISFMIQDASDVVLLLSCCRAARQCCQAISTPTPRDDQVSLSQSLSSSLLNKVKRSKTTKEVLVWLRIFDWQVSYKLA